MCAARDAHGVEIEAAPCDLAGDPDDAAALLAALDAVVAPVGAPALDLAGAPGALEHATRVLDGHLSNVTLAQLLTATRAAGFPHIQVDGLQPTSSARYVPPSAPPAPAGGLADDHRSALVADELLKLKRLLDAGALTQTEFDAQKMRLLV